MVIYARTLGKEATMSNEKTGDEAETLWERTRLLYVSMLAAPEERSQIERYFSMICGVKRDGSKMVFSTTNSKAAEMLTRDHAEKIRKFMAAMANEPALEVEFRFDETRIPQIVIPADENSRASLEKKENPAQTKTRQQVFISTMPLKEDYTFDEFVEGPSNSWAYASAKGVVAHPGAKEYNPLFIHGGTGLGKTHLMQAIGNELRKTNPELTVCYLTSETFVNEYINAVQNGHIASFRERYRNIDVLLVDDVQFFQRGKNVQEEFFNTFNDLQAQKKQIVMTCDVSPKNLPALEERMISRFVGGMVQEIESPSYETRLAILQKKTENQPEHIPLSTLEFIAKNIKTHVRAMEGALAKVRVIFSMKPGAEIPPVMLEKFLKDFIDNDRTLRKMTVEEIQDAVSKKFGVKREAILSLERSQSMVTPRQLAMYIARKYTSKSLEEIGQAFNKSHATILHGVRQISRRLDVEADLRVMMEQILAEFGVTLEGEHQQ